MQTVTFDIEANNLLNEETIDYLSSPYKLKDAFKMHCIVVEEHGTGNLIAFYDGDTIALDGRPYQTSRKGFDYDLSNYQPIEYEHKLISEFPEYVRNNVCKVVAHNGINYDLLVCKLYYGMDYSVGPDTWDGREVEVVDTLVTSKTLNPDRFGGHSLDALGKKVGLNKIEFRKHVPLDHRFEFFFPDMLYYCIRDVQVNTKVYQWLESQKGDWNWTDSIQLEKEVAELVTRQEHRGFLFDKVLAENNITELDGLMGEREKRVAPVLPPRPATQAFMKDFTPPKNQFKKDGSYSAHLLKFVEKHGGVLEDRTLILWGKRYDLPLPQEPLVTEMKATVNDTTHIKNWLVGLGWEPSEWKDKDITVNSKKLKLDDEKYEATVDRYVAQTAESNFGRHRAEHLKCSQKNIKAHLMARPRERSIKVMTNPSFTKGQEKEMCPNLEVLFHQFPYAKDVVEFLTYKHRRNSILGGGLDYDDEGEADKGYLAHVREDGRIATPADTCGAACVVGNTLIITDNGTVPIVDVCVGDLVLTHKGVYRPVLERIYNGVKPTVEVTFENGVGVTSTYNHPFLTEEGWKRADELTEGVEVFSYQGEEAWKHCPQYPTYIFSSWGRIFNQQGKQLTTNKRTALWSRADVDVLDKEGNKKKRGIGCLVLETFLEARPKGKECCHRDGNPMNNSLENLYWGSSKENSADAKVHGKSLKAAREKSRLTQEQVNEIREHFLHFGVVRGDTQVLAKKYGVSREHIRDIRLNRRWKEGNLENMYRQGFSLTKVKSIVRKGCVPTYDITVEDDHSYVANGIVTHNTSRFKHRVVTNIPRVTSLYGEKMRGLFGVDTTRCYQVGYDFDSLEAKEESHYCWRYEAGKEKAYCNSLTLEKPFDVHTMMAQKISGIIKRDFGRSPAKNVKYGCLPVDNSQVLTREGWAEYSDLVVGQDVLSYNQNLGHYEWKPITKLWYYENAEVVILKNKWVSLESTRDHNWFGYRSTKKRGEPRVRNEQFFTTEEINSEYGILHAAEYREESNITKDQAALVAWLLSDGYYKWSELSETTSSSEGKLKGIVGSVGQDQKKYVKELEEVLKNNKAEYVVDVEDTFNVYRFKSPFLRNFLDDVVGSRLQKHDVDWVSWILKLDQESLKEFLHHFWLADGHGHKSTKHITQNKGNILDAVMLAGNLTGQKVTFSSKTEKCKVLNLSPNAFTSGQRLVREFSRETDVFCLTNDNSTFVTRQNGFITLTGNCTYGATAPKVAKTIGSDLPTGVLVFNAFWEAAAPLKKLKDALNNFWETKGKKKFIPGLDGRQVPTRSAHAILNSLFQSAGVICAKRAMVIHDRLLKKEGLLIDFFKDDWQNMQYAQQLCAYHK